MGENCKLLTRKEYDELVTLSKSKKPEHISIFIKGYNSFYYDPFEINGSISLSSDTTERLRKIYYDLRNRFAKSIETIVKKEFIKEKEDFNKMPWYKKMVYKFELE